MSSPPTFLLDANVFIEAAERYYAFDLVPAFWEQLAHLGKSGRVFTIDRIAKEVKGDGPLKTWMDGPFAGCIQSSDSPATVNHFSNLMQWAQEQSFTDAAKSEFASVPDAWLIAHAKAVGAIVVTHETFDANCRRRVKIPNACRFIDVRYVNTFEMLRMLGVKLGSE